MSKKYVSVALCAIILFQVLILAGEYLGAVYPLWTGKEVKLKTVPIDPRSLFRGNYARLNYDISQIMVADTKSIDEPRNGEVIYVSLKENNLGIYEVSQASFEQPDAGLYIRGRIIYGWIKDEYNVKYGIEAFFAPKEDALALENKLRDGGVAVVMVAENGKATLKDVIDN